MTPTQPALPSPAMTTWIAAVTVNGPHAATTRLIPFEMPASATEDDALAVAQSPAFLAAHHIDALADIGVHREERDAC